MLLRKKKKNIGSSHQISPTSNLRGVGGLETGIRILQMQKELSIECEGETTAENFTGLSWYRVFSGNAFLLLIISSVSCFHNLSLSLNWTFPSRAEINPPGTRPPPCADRSVVLEECSSRRSWDPCGSRIWGRTVPRPQKGTAVGMSFPASALR